MKSVSRFLPISGIGSPNHQAQVDDPAIQSLTPWKLLIVDDDADIHALTRMTLNGFTFADRPIDCISARSAHEARCLMTAHPDIALILLDVVMETDDAGLQLVRFIRENLNNQIVQIVLRTGQPGLVPQREVICRYEINGYSSKIELTAEKMFSIVAAAFRSYQMAASLDRLNLQLQQELAERKRVEEEVRRLIRFQEIVIDNADIWLDVRDAAGSPVIWNKASERISGYSKGEAVGNHGIMKRLYPETGEAEEKRRAQCIGSESKDMVLSFENRIQCKDGSSRVVSWNLHALHSDQGEPIGIVTLGRDVTEQRVLEEQLRQANKMQVAGRMAAGFANDFTSLLSVVRGYCDIALSCLAPSERIYGHLKQIDKAAERAEMLTRKVLAIGTAQPFILQPVSLNLFIRENRKMLERLAGQSIQVVLQCDESIQAIEANPVKIDQVIVNLAMNAVEAMPHGGVLTVSTSALTIGESGKIPGIAGVKPGRYVELRVADTGIGMTQATKEQMFEPFFSTREDNGGKGLGLSIVYGVVVQCHGFITVETAPGKGTAVIIYFPCTDRRANQTVSSFPGPNQFFGTETVLVVEDHPDVLASTSETLQIYGYTVLQAATSDQALKVCEERQADIDLLLTDLVMPGMNGSELAGRVTGMNPDIKVLYMSGYSSQIVGRKGLLPTGDDFIEKPFTAIRLLRMLRRVLDNA